MIVGYSSNKEKFVYNNFNIFQAIPGFVDILQNSNSDDAELCAAAWTIGHVAKHSPQHSLAIAVANALPRLLQVLLSFYFHLNVIKITLCRL